MDLKSLYQEILNEHNLNPSHKGVTDGASLTLQGVIQVVETTFTFSLKLTKTE